MGDLHKNSPPLSDLDLKLPVFDLISSIKELQGLEEYLFQKLEGVNMTDTNNIKEQNDIIDHINDLSELRNNLFGQLGKIYIDLDKNSQIERKALTDQITTTNMMENQLNNLKNDVQLILDARNNKLRMVEIGEYEYLRYSAHGSAMKTIAFMSVAILVFSVLLKNDFIPLIIAKMGIIGTCVIGGVILMQKLWSMITRSNMNYNRFEQPSLASVKVDDSYPETVWQHDKNFFRQVFEWGKEEAESDWADIKKYAHKAESVF